MIKHLGCKINKDLYYREILNLWENVSLRLFNKYYNPIILLGWNQGQQNKLIIG